MVIYTTYSIKDILLFMFIRQIVNNNLHNNNEIRMRYNTLLERIFSQLQCCIIDAGVTAAVVSFFCPQKAE